jgi:putative transposase
LPAELQQRVHMEVQQAKRRSGWPVRRTLAALGISRSSYYRWLHDEAWTKPKRAPDPPVQVYEALLEERQAVKQYALDHPEIRHRELAWRMIDDDIAYLSSSTVYRILKQERLICEQAGRKKRYREDVEKAQRPNQRWGTDLMYVKVGGTDYFFVAFIDEYSRYIVHWELLSDMGANSVSLAARAALESLPCAEDGQPHVRPEIRSDNGSCYISREFHGLLQEFGLTHQRIKPYCPEENGIMERANRTFREAIELVELTDRYQAEEELTKIIDWYNHERLHSSLGFLRPVNYYRGQQDELHEARRRKLSTARHRRRETNLKLRQPTLPLEAGK